MLDEVTPEQFDEWVAFRRIEPEPLERITEVLKLGFAGVCNAWGAKVEPNDFDPDKKEKEKPHNVSPDVCRSMLTTFYAMQ